MTGTARTERPAPRRPPVLVLIGSGVHASRLAVAIRDVEGDRVFDHAPTLIRALRRVRAPIVVVPLFIAPGVTALGIVRRIRERRPAVPILVFFVPGPRLGARLLEVVREECILHHDEMELTLGARVAMLRRQLGRAHRRKDDGDEEIATAAHLVELL